MDMKKAVANLEQIKMPQAWQNNMDLTSNYCNKHTFRKGGEDHIKPIQTMMIGGKEVCPRCESEKWESTLQANIQKQHDEAFANRKKNMLLKKSVFTDRTILDASFETYEVMDQEERTNKETCLEAVEHFKQ